LRQAYPGKRIVIAEFGWPSAGYNLKNAEPGRIEQAVVLRDFVSRAEAFGIDYNIVEAIDQPWKIFEGGVGPYWGLFDAARHPKFSWTGSITNPDHWPPPNFAPHVRPRRTSKGLKEEACLPRAHPASCAGR